MWVWLFLCLIIGIFYGYLAVYNFAVLLIRYAGHVWFDKPREPVFERVMHYLWMITGTAVCILFVSFPFLEGLRIGS